MKFSHKLKNFFVTKSQINQINVRPSYYMKILLYALILLSMCNLYLIMSDTSVKMDKTRRKRTTMTSLNRSLRRRRVRRTTTTENINTQREGYKTDLVEYDNVLQVGNRSRSRSRGKHLVTRNCTTVTHLPNTRLHEVVLRTPFVLSYDQQEVLTRVVKKLWWNCR